MEELIKMIKGDYTVPDEFSILYSGDLTVNSNSNSWKNFIHEAKYRVIHKEEFKKYYQIEQKNSRPKVIFAFIMLLLTIILCIPAGFLLTDTPMGDNRTGIVKGNQIKYVDNTVKYVTLEEIGLSKSKVQEGESVSLYFDRNGLIEAIPEKEETENMIRGIGLTIILVFIFPFVIVFGMKGGSGKFSIGSVAKQTYKFENSGSKIKMERLCASLNKDNQCFESELEPIYYEQTIRYKSYKNKFTCVKCKLYIPSKKKSVKEKIWILNDEPLYEKIINSKNKNI